MRIFYDTTMDKVLNQCSEEFLLDKHPDFISNIDSSFYNVQIYSESCEFNFDIGKRLWLNKSRWSSVVSDYLTLDKVNSFKKRCQMIIEDNSSRPKSTIMLFNNKEYHEKIKKHKWGGCLMGLVFRSLPGGGFSMTLTSRTTYFTTTAFIDVAMAHVLIRDVLENFNDVTLFDISFDWFIVNGQIPHFKSLPYLYSDKNLLGILENKKENSPTMVSIRLWYKKIKSDYQKYGIEMATKKYEKFGPFRRAKDKLE